MPVEALDRLAAMLDAEAAEVSAEVDDFFDRLLPLPDDTRAVNVVDPVPEREVLAVWRRSQGRSPAVRALVAGLEA